MPASLKLVGASAKVLGNIELGKKVRIEADSVRVAGRTAGLYGVGVAIIDSI